MRRLYPEPAGPTSPAQLAAGDRHRVGDRPWVGVCMITSLDGTTVVDGRSGPLSTGEDRALLVALRAAADVVLVGAGTVRGEGYGAPKRAGLRIGVVSTTGDVDASSELFASGAGFLVLPEDGPRAPATADVVRAGSGRVDLALALTRLGDVVPAPLTYVHVEGGPRLNGSLLEAGCVDELNLTLSPFLAGGAGARAVVGVPPVLTGYELVHLALGDDSFLFGRWNRAS